MPRDLTSVIAVYPGCTLLDFIGPYTALSLFSDVQFAWLDTKPVTSDSGAQFTPTTALGEVRDDVDVLLVPGGGDTSASLSNEAFIAEIRRIGEKSRYVTSVCTGSLFLGAAGLLKGYAAASHWTTMELLPLVGAIPTHRRWVKDRNRITGGGVTAGIDFGLVLVSELVGERNAKIAQLFMEYQPEPPFNSGSPSSAESDIVEEVRSMVDGDNRRTADALRRCNI
ncbi:hypothetical protein BKG77_09855 [Mycobacteroides chelonae]|uniref:DJ-1/PfpI family protein n=1 Tax=Mycobacteroides chelonae TaxID=1774 RepID=UPI0008AA4479|nr:DJ-1/PfpI family protein [Mycobacteroides chelonae]OHU23875.1 hypothetical protein BKG77_09855 [Mycobacteroides chelonae]